MKPLLSSSWPKIFLTSYLLLAAIVAVWIKFHSKADVFSNLPLPTPTLIYTQPSPFPTPTIICDDKLTTIDINDCLSDHLKILDVQLDKQATLLHSTSVVSKHQDEIKTLTDSISSFRKYRETNCYLRSITFQGGSGRGSVYLTCAIDETQSQIESLKNLYNDIKDRNSFVPTTTPLINTNPTITSLSQTILPLLKFQDFSTLAKYVHPIQGLRFSPYSYIQPDSQDFTVSQIPSLPTSQTEYLWGYTDGSGFPIKTRFSEYFQKYIFDRDYTQAPQSKTNELVKIGNTQSNISNFFPNSQFVEYHFPGTKSQEFMNWSSLRLVFQQYNSNWYLVAIIHDQWTI